MALPRVVDLYRVAQAAKGDPRYRRLRAEIDRALRVQSCVADLGQAMTILKSWDKLRNSARGSGSEERVGTETALLFTGVSLYVRATWSSTKKGDRGSINIDHELADEQRLDHRALVDIRNQVFAHVYPDRQVVGDVWHENLCIAVEGDEGWRIGGAVRSTWHHGPVWGALIRQVPIASAILKQRFRIKVDGIASALNAVGISSDLLLQGLIDPASAFGNADAAAKMMPDQVGRAFVARPAADTLPKAPRR